MSGFRNKMICKDESDLANVASSLLNHFKGKRFFAFYGEMGAGKTTLIKTLCDFIYVTDTVCSPTFSLVNIYQTQNRQEVYHFDLYRINSVEELYDIGYEDYFYSEKWCFVEWAEKIEDLLPDFTVRIRIEVTQPEGLRIIHY